MMRKILVTIVIITSFVLIAVADEHSDRLDDWYKPNGWDGKDSKSKPGFNLGEFKVKGCKGGEIEHRPDNPSRREYKKDEKPAFNVFVKVFGSAEEAHKLLLAFLGNVSHPDKMPRTSELDLSIGHIGYIFTQDGKTHWVAFVRNNVFVILMIADVDADVDLTVVAEDIDDAIEKLQDVKKLPKPEIKTFEAEKPDVKLDEKVVLDIEVKANSDGDVDLHFEIKGEGQGYVEKGEDDKYYFKSTGKGKVKIIVTSTNSLCNQSQSEVEINVS